MKVLGIMGSPRIKSNTDLLLDQALAGARSQDADIEKIIIDNLTVTPCKEYYGCERDGNCVIRDDMDSIYPRLLEADVIIVASPMFFYGITGQLKSFVDRCQALWVRKHVLKQDISGHERKGVFIAVGATRGQQLFDGSILTMKYFFDAVGVTYTDQLLVRGIDKKGEIKEHPTALSDAYELGKRIAVSISHK